MRKVFNFNTKGKKVKEENKTHLIRWKVNHVNFKDVKPIMKLNPVIDPAPDSPRSSISSSCSVSENESGNAKKIDIFVNEVTRKFSKIKGTEKKEMLNV